jgi:hypothetical protein
MEKTSGAWRCYRLFTTFRKEVGGVMTPPLPCITFLGNCVHKPNMYIFKTLNDWKDDSYLFI